VILVKSHKSVRNHLFVSWITTSCVAFVAWMGAHLGWIGIWKGVPLSCRYSASVIMGARWSCAPLLHVVLMPLRFLALLCKVCGCLMPLDHSHWTMVSGFCAIELLLISLVNVGKVFKYVRSEMLIKVFDGYGEKLKQLY